MKASAVVTPIALVVLAAGAGAYAYLVDRGTVSDADRAARRRDVFPSFRVDDVRRVELSHGAETMVLERDADGGGGTGSWTMTAPSREHADAAAVDALLRELELATRLREVGDGDPTGVDGPRARGRLDVGALDYRFALGSDAPRPDGAAYMRLDGEGTFVVGRSVKVQLLRGADAYRDRTLVPCAASELARLEVRPAGGAGFAVDRKGSTFRVAGDGLRVSRAAMDHLLSALADARVDTFLTDAEGDRATANPRLTVLLAREAGRPRVELRIGGECPGHAEEVVVVRASPTRVSACAAKAVAEALETTAAALVDASPLFAHADEIEELRLEPASGAGPRIDVARRGTGWHERAPEDRDLSSDETDSVNALTLALAEARGVEVHRGNDERFEVRGRATVVRTGGSTDEVLEIAPAAADGTVSIRRVDDGAVLRVPRDVGRRFEPHPIALRARPIWNAQVDAGSVVAIDDTCGPTAQHLELRDRDWVMRAPQGFAADPVSVADLAAAIAHARADAWVAESDDGTFGFARPGGCSVTLTVSSASGDAGPRRVSLIFGAELDGRVYARTPDDPAVFVAPASLRGLASHPAIDRGRIRVDPAALRAVTLVHDGARRSMASDGGDDDRMAGALAGFYAQSAVRTGPPTHDEGTDRPTLEILAAATRITVGAPTRIDGVDSYFARVSGVDATFAVPRQAVDAILSAW